MRVAIGRCTRALETKNCYCGVSETPPTSKLRLENDAKELLRPDMSSYSNNGCDIQIIYQTHKPQAYHTSQSKPQSSDYRTSKAPAVMRNIARIACL